MGWQHSLAVFVAHRIQMLVAPVSDSLYPGNRMDFGVGSAAQTAGLDVVVAVREETVGPHRPKDSSSAWRSSLLHVLPVPDEDVHPCRPLPQLHPDPPPVESKLIPRWA
jgi:hypothetical protein